MYFKKVLFSYYLLTTVILFVFICLFSAVIAINSISELQSARNQLVSYFEKEVVIPAFTLKSLLEINDFDGYDILLKNEDVCENIQALGRQLKGKVVLVSEVLGIQMNENCEKTMTSDLSWYNKFRKSNDKIQFEMGDRTNPKIYIDFKVYNDNEFVGAISFGISYKDILDSLSEKIGGQRVELLISKNSGRDVLELLRPGNK
ncbi:hypothetical protein [Pseudoalteromonas xiamenensis]|uniref:Uncharacterized protein n=1 Tax=Pseudoalteromonas xiamenensis TaxID=882626 RepID=A0A975DKW1_9GAMM|nr:hypothetical protein [Pseudoalteromonas xiamenensis]QTH72995.1 hypothetical protein J5O05_17200 [Pseudoalteromonas xiamenensis]